MEDIWVAIIAAASVLMGSLLTSLITEWSEGKRRAADKEREDKRIEREDASAAEEKEKQEREADAPAGNDIARQFFQVREHVQGFAATDGYFEDFFNGKWDSSRESQLRLLIGAIRDSEARSRLVAVLDALLDFEPLAPFSGVSDTRRFVMDALTLGGELALAIARGQNPERKHLREFEALRLNLGEWDDFLAKQAQLRAQQERERLEQEEELRQYRREEAAAERLADIQAEIDDELGLD